MEPQKLDEARWTAVQTRDTSRDADFVYAVRTTGVFCRPGCRSRMAKRDNILFFASAKEAAAAGFRACKRCRPDLLVTDIYANAIEQACAALRTEETEPSLAALAEMTGLSAGHFQRLFKARIGLSPKQYAKAARVQRLRETLPEAPSVTAAIYDAGYNASSRAYADGHALGMAPKAYRRGAPGEIIRYAAAQSSLGDVLVAATEHGVCMVEFGPVDHLVAKLKARFSKADVAPAPDGLAETVAAVVARIDDPTRQQPLPLDIRGTAFQQRVWQELLRTKAGETVSYAALAERIGAPGGARAVAGACGANAIAVAVPCHRVIGQSGGLCGYRWGVERKQALLKRERRNGKSER